MPSPLDDSLLTSGSSHLPSPLLPAAGRRRILRGTAGQHRATSRGVKRTFFRRGVQIGVDCRRIELRRCIELCCFGLRCIDIAEPRRFPRANAARAILLLEPRRAIHLPTSLAAVAAVLAPRGEEGSRATAVAKAPYHAPDHPLLLLRSG